MDEYIMDPLVDEYIKAFPLHVYFQKHLSFLGLWEKIIGWMKRALEMNITQIYKWMDEIIHQWIGKEGTWMNITQIHKWMDEIIHQWIDEDVSWMNNTRIL